MHRHFQRKRSDILFIRHTPHPKGKLKQLSRIARLGPGEPKKATPPTFLAIFIHPHSLEYALRVAGMEFQYCVYGMLHQYSN